MALEIRLPQLTFTGSSTKKSWVQVQVTPTPNSLLGFNASSVPANVTIGSGLALAGNVLSATNSGSVTSVGLSMPTGFSVANSPVTSTGTLAVSTTLNGILYGDGANTIAAVTIGSGLSFAAGTLSATGAGGTVTSVSVVTANGVSGSVATATTTPAITLTLGAITPTTVNGLTISTTTGTLTITNGKIFSVSNTLTLAGTDGSTLNVGAGGTLGTAAFTAASAYEVPLTFSTGLTRSTNTITVNTSQNIATLSNLTSNGIVTTSGGTGALSVTATTGSGSVVLATSPTLVTPALGTPSAIVLTNATGLPISTGVSGLGSGVAAFLGTTTGVTVGSIPVIVSSVPGFAWGSIDSVLALLAAPIPVTLGGTGRATGATAYGLIAAGTTATGVHQTLAAGATTELLVGGGASALPVWTTATGTGAPVRAGSPTFTGTVTMDTLTVATFNFTTWGTGTVPVVNGGTGRATSTTAYGLIAAGTTATGAHQTLAAGATTEILVGGGASALPVWTTASGTGAPVRATAPTMGGHWLQDENSAIQLDTALSADGKYCGIVEAGTAGAALAFGDLVYLAVADSRWELADADAESTSGPVDLAICVLAAAADGDPTVLLRYGKVRADTAFPTLTVGAPAYVGTTAGDIQVAQPSGADDCIRVVGRALTADVLLFNPSPDWMVHV
jgi:hypothetical protein